MSPLEDRDLSHASSHWREYGQREEEGFGTQRHRDWADLLGAPLLALSSPQRLAVLRGVPGAASLSRRMGLAFTQDSVRQLCTRELLRRHLDPQPSILVIGDGFGVLSGLLADAYPGAAITLVDLSFALAAQRRHLGRAFGAERFTFVHAAEIHRTVLGSFQLAVNVASMQEMDPAEVDRYFSFMRGRVDLFYCCNREHKTLPDGTVSAFDRYPWHPDDRILVDGPCPWHQWFLTSRPPFVRRYDGRHRHRLARLAAPG